MKNWFFEKRCLFFALILFGAAALLVNAQTKIDREEPFTGPSSQAADWIKKHDRALRNIAKDVSKVITYGGKTEAGGSGVTLSFYDYRDSSNSQVGTVLEIIENSTGNVVYVVWSDEARGDDAVFFNDADKTQHDVSIASRGRKYGMGGDTIALVKTIVKEL